jgi:hypothetical protein
MQGRLARNLLILAFMMMVLGIFLWAKDAFAQVDPPTAPEPQKVRSGIIREKITNVPQTMLPAQPVKIVTYCLLVGGAADEVVKLQPIGGGTPSISIAVPAGATVGKNFNAQIPQKGFEVLTLTEAGDVSVKCDFITSTTP